MASNKELIDQIKAINPEAQTDGLKNAELLELLKTTKESVESPTEGVSPVQVADVQKVAEADAAAKAQAEADAAAKAQAEADAAAKAQAEADAAEPTEPVYVVAEGASITSKKGILGPGSEVKAQYFAHNGEEILNSLLDRGLVEVK